MDIATPSAYSFVELVTATQLPIKLSSSNYPTCYKQVILLLTANNVLGYVYNTLPCPPTTIGTGDTTVENPAFIAWKLQDNYVFLALFGTCGPEAQIVISSTTSSADAMSRLPRFMTIDLALGSSLLKSVFPPSPKVILMSVTICALFAP